MKIEFKVKDKKYVLTSDSKQFILGVDHGNDKDGKQLVKEHIYFPKLQLMIEHLYDIGVRDNNVDSLRALVKHSEEIKEEVLRVSKLFTIELEQE